MVTGVKVDWFSRTNPATLMQLHAQRYTPCLLLQKILLPICLIHLDAFTGCAALAAIPNAGPRSDYNRHL
jgi:hypothetical protein